VLLADDGAAGAPVPMSAEEEAKRKRAEKRKRQKEKKKNQWKGGVLHMCDCCIATPLLLAYHTTSPHTR